MSTTEYPPVRFDAMTRKQAITTCLALEDMRDRAVAEVARLRAGESAPDEVRPENAYPTPAQFIRGWNEMTPEQRLTRAARIVDALEYSSNARERAIVERR
jgi:hypothetical protein